MSRVRSARQINSALGKKGFFIENDGDHVRYFHLDSLGVETGIKTKISHGALEKTISAKLMSLMAQQLHLTKKQLLGLIDCSLDEEGYRKILHEAGVGV